ncbi:MAG: response regulator transcription factor [Flavobacteriales bacterium]|nr:response regulator transcription factor [Flavobacteriales bacterium]
MEKGRILLVEDEPTLRSTLKMNFELEGYAVTTALTGPEGLDRLRGARFDLVVMDVMLPGLDGYTVIETVRLEGDTTPVLFLTARNAPADRIRGLRAGDDHLSKPFDLEELLLRIGKLVRRHGSDEVPTNPTTYSFAGNHLDFTSYEAIGRNGEKRTLSQREAMLLRLLVEKAGQVVSREEILQKVWGYNVFPTTRTVDNFIVAFRKYFEVDPRVPQHFHSIRGVGVQVHPLIFFRLAGNPIPAPPSFPQPRPSSWSWAGSNHSLQVYRAGVPKGPPFGFWSGIGSRRA